MSERNVDLHRRFIDAFNARDMEAMISCCDPGIEYHSQFAAADGAVYHGHDGIRRWHRDLEEVWGAEIRAEPEAYFDLGQHTSVSYMFHGRGQRSGAKVAMPGTQVARWREGRMVYVRGYTQRDDALHDLGVSEDELEPIAPRDRALTDLGLAPEADSKRS
jgi:ketosteroid isomerase-like protein